MSDVLVKVDNVSKRFCRSLKRSLWTGLQDLGSEIGDRNQPEHVGRRPGALSVRSLVLAFLFDQRLQFQPPMPTPTLLVTGSSGLIGSEVCSHFASLGWQVYGLDNNQRAVFFGTPATRAGISGGCRSSWGKFPALDSTSATAPACWR